MRADRLLTLLILLQTRGRMPARKLAEELEVSERTIYRDILALSTAGIPVYAERGPGGGCALLESYRTNLTGLNEAEARALFMLTIPAPLTELGVSKELKTALLKLSAALPASRRKEEERSRQRIYLDSVPWSSEEGPVPHLQTIYQAIWQDRRLHLVYSPRFGTQVERLVDPYGLVAKTDIWYLVAARKNIMRVYRIARILEAHLTAEPFERLLDFDLGAYWNQRCTDIESLRPTYPVLVRIAPELIPHLPHYFGDHFHARYIQVSPPDSGGRSLLRSSEGWITLTMIFESLEAARDSLLGLGRAVEVLDPIALRMSLVDFAKQIVAGYAVE